MPTYALETPSFCIEALQDGSNPDAILSKMADSISDRVQWLITNKPDAKNVCVRWINVRHPKNNPDENIGFFRVIGSEDPSKTSNTATRQPVVWTLGLAEKQKAGA